MGKVYLDHAATTPVDPAVVAAMQPYWHETFGNPSSIHAFGREARAAIDTARDTVARCLGARPEEILFTSSGTEANNTVLQGVFATNLGRGHVVTSAIEHHAILTTCQHLAPLGLRTTYLPVDQHGLVDPDDVRRAIDRETVLVSVMYANNEIGTIQPLAEIGRICREAGVPFHTDAVQAPGMLPLRVDDLGVDFLSISAHKFYGPKGVGVLYARTGTRFAPLLYGGGQERGLRAGTENVAGIVGLAKALALAVSGRDAAVAQLTALRDRFIESVLARVEHCRLNGHPTQRLPNNAHFSVEFVEGEALLLNLDLLGIAASSGSACMSGAQEPSHVLQAIGLPREVAVGSIRFTLGRSTTAAEVDQAADAFADTVARLRAMSPFYADAMRTRGR